MIFLYEKMTALGFEIAKPSGAFYLFAKIPTGYEQDSMAFCVDLAEKNQLAIIPGIAFGPEARRICTPKLRRPAKRTCKKP